MWTVLRIPGVAPLFGASCVARLPMGALGLLLVLDTQAASGSYARGGLAAGAYALALAVSNPLLARLVDRRGQTVVLRTGAAVAAAAILTLALLPEGAPFGIRLAMAALCGAAQPPVGACMRGLWPQLVGDPARRHAAYSLESVVLEVVYIFGPLVLVAGIGSWSLRAALVACALSIAAGDLAFSLQPASRNWRPREQRRTLAGALAGRGVRVLLAVFGLAGLAVGAVEVVVPAILTPLGQRDLTGVMLTLWGLGSLAGGLVSSRIGVAERPARRLALLMAAWGGGHAAVGLAHSPVSMGLLLFLAGGTIAPTFVCANGMLDDVAPLGTLTEAFTWLSTGLSVGLAAGSALAGALVESLSPEAAMAFCGVGGLLAAVLMAVSSPAALRPVPAPARVKAGGI